MEQEIVKKDKTAELPTSDSKTLVLRFLSYIDRSPRTAQTYMTNLRQFFSWLSERGIKNPTREDVINYRDYCAERYKPNTTAQYLRATKQFFSWLDAEGLYPDIAKNIHAPTVFRGTLRREALGAEDVLAIETRLAADRQTEKGRRLHAMFVLAVNAGLRTIELSRADVKDYVRKGKKAYLHVWGKGHHEADQVKALSPELADILDEYLATRALKPTAASPLFVATGNRSGGKRLAARSISSMLKKAMVDAGYNSERLTAHSLRHTAGTTVMLLTGNLFETQQYLRHANPATTELYLHVEREEADAATAAKVWDFYHGKTEQKLPKEKVRALLDGASEDQIAKIMDILEEKEA